MIENLLLGVGPPRTGTTWLHQRLSRHSRLKSALGNLKEVHYFDLVHGIEPARAKQLEHFAVAPGIGRTRRREILERRIINLAEVAAAHSRARERCNAQIALIRAFLDEPMSDPWYEALFAAAPGDWCIDVTPSYVTLPPGGFDHMKRVARRLDIVLLVRNPIDWLSSNLRKAQDSNRINLAQLTRAGKEELVVRLSATADYRRIIPALRQAFGRDHVHWFWFDDIIDRPRDMIEAILSRLGLGGEEACFTDMGRAPNPTPTLPLDGEMLALAGALCAPAIDWLDRELGGVPARWRDALTRASAER